MTHSPPWKTNLFIFIALISVIGSYFYHQTTLANREFQKHSQEHSEILATVVGLNIHNALLARKGLETIIADSLANSGRFLASLNQLEPFSSEELSAFAKQSGFTGVKIISATNVVSGPDNWLPELHCGKPGSLNYLAEEQLYLYTHSEGAENDPTTCIIIAKPAKNIDKTLSEISVRELLESLNNLHEIDNIRLQKKDDSSIPQAKKDTTEIRLPMEDDRQLVVTLKTTRLGKRRARMQKEFIIFILFLIVLGGLSSWWLYRIQQQSLQKTREFEQKMARQHEDAALGRATATITHELRNPLNVIGMGLQLLEIESNSLKNEQKEMLHSMLESVQRSNTIISKLKQYGDTFTVSPAPVVLQTLLEGILKLYQVQCQQQHIVTEFIVKQETTLHGDRLLLSQLFENMIKNSIEAQPNGGSLTINCRTTAKQCVIEISNGGFTLQEEESKLLLQPYFTSKSRGTGLGLVIGNKIIQAHGGKLDYTIDFPKQQIHFFITLPLYKE